MIDDHTCTQGGGGTGGVALPLEVHNPSPPPSRPGGPNPGYPPGVFPSQAKNGLKFDFLN